MENNAEKLIKMLIEKGLTITTAESCTGGMISSALVDISGASSVLNECHVTYANEAKMKYLDVKKETLDNYGAVSMQTVDEMVKGAAKLANSNVAIAVSGLAGPGGGTKEKPVGLVYIGCYVDGEVVVKENIFSGNRYEIRSMTTKKAIELACEMLEKSK